MLGKLLCLKTGRFQMLLMLNTSVVFIYSFPDWSFSFSYIFEATLIAIDNLNNIFNSHVILCLSERSGAFENLF